MVKVIVDFRGGCLLIWTALLVSCSSGAPGGTSGAPANDGSSLSGRFVSAEPAFDKSWTLDLGSGRYTTIPGTQWGEVHPVCDAWTRSTVYPSSSGHLIVETVDHCTNGDQAFEQVHALFVRDSEGVLLNSVGISTIVGGVRGPGRLSPDGELIALPVDFGDTVYRLALIDWQQEELVAKGPPISGRAYAWLPDNRLIYADDENVYLTAPDSVDGEFLFSADSDGGSLQDFAVSPDGRNLAMVVVDRGTLLSSYGIPWIVDLQTLEWRQLAHVDDPLSSDDNARIEYPTWSPDGSKIALMYGLTRTAGWADLYVLPADADNVLLSEDSEMVTLVNSWYSQLWPHDAEPEYGPAWLLEGPFAWLPDEN